MKTRIVIFAKAPVPGRAKTRLIPALGPEGAAALAGRMLRATVAAAAQAGLGPPELCTDPAPEDPVWTAHLPEEPLRLSAQGPGGLGERMTRAAERVTDEGESVLLIGTDCPDLNASRLAAAARSLRRHDAVIHPAKDGGYVLLGLRRFHPSLFSGIAWGGPDVAATTLARIEALGWTVDIRETLADVDDPEDLAS